MRIRSAGVARFQRLDTSCGYATVNGKELLVHRSLSFAVVENCKAKQVFPLYDNSRVFCWTITQVVSACTPGGPRSWSGSGHSLFRMSDDKMGFPLVPPSLRGGARGYGRLGTCSDVRRVLVQSNVLVTARTLEYLHLRSDVSSFPISSSQFLYTSTCFPCCQQKSVSVSAGFLHPARALRWQQDI